MGSLLARFLAGGLAGLAAWVVMEPAAPKSLAGDWDTWERTFMLVYGAFIGLVIGGYDGFTRGGKVHFFRGLSLGAVLGAIGGTLGDGMGGRIVETVFGKSVFLGTNIAMAIPARILVFTLLGACLGVAIGLSSLTGKRVIQGAVGGAIGGAIGGASFDIIGVIFGAFILTAQGQTSGEVGGPSRAVSFTLIAAMIALFIGLVERLSRSAWLRLNLGRNEGKEWSIDSPQTFIGRREGATVPLLGDPNVAPIHASIQKQGGQYILNDAGSPIGTFVNGQRVQQVVLAPGSMIQIGSFTLQFLIKGIPAPVFSPEMAMRAQGAYPRQPMVNQAPMPQPMPQAMPQPMQPMPQPMNPAANRTVAYGSSPVASPTMSLVVLDGPMAGQRVPVAGAVEIGREAAGIRLASDTSASRRHASVTASFSGVQLQDLGSTNGTFLNGQRVQSADARPGDVIKVGSTSFRVEAG